jgi:hypothetical protein
VTDPADAKANKPTPDPPAASPGEVFVQFSAQKSETAAPLIK